MARRVAALLLGLTLSLLSGEASASVLAAKQGTQETFTGTGTGTNYVACDGSGAVLFIYSSTGAAGGTIKEQVSVDGGTIWVDVTSSSQTPTVTTASAVSVTAPIGIYRAVCTAHTNGTHSVKYQCAGRY